MIQSGKSCYILTPLSQSAQSTLALNLFHTEFIFRVFDVTPGLCYSKKDYAQKAWHMLLYCHISWLTKAFGKT